MVPKRNYFRCKDTQTEREGMEKDIPCKWKLSKKVGYLYLYQTNGL